MLAPAESPAADRRASRWADLRLRVLSALVLVPVALGAVWAGGTWWTLLVCVAASGLIWEWWSLRRHRTDGRSAPTLLGGWLYVAAGAGALWWLRADSVAGLINVVFLLLIVWASDIGAYLFGRALGGPKLAPQISPGKTWSGAVGGLLAAMAAGALVAQLSAPGPVSRTLLVCAGLSIASQAGDLLESAAKRYFGVKDSSHLIPGHGGLFDRLDGVLGAAPLALLLALARGPGVEIWR